MTRIPQFFLPLIGGKTVGFFVLECVGMNFLF